MNISCFSILDEVILPIVKEVITGVVPNRPKVPGLGFCVRHFES